MDSNLVNVTQAANTLGVKPETVRRYIREGVLPAKRLPGGGLRINGDALDEVLKPVCKE